MKKFANLALVAILCCVFVLAAVGCDDTPAHKHEWEMTHDSANHWFKCKTCDETKDLAPHDLKTISTTPAGCTTEGVVVKKCDACGYEKEIHSSEIGHKYELKHDGTNHWQECKNCQDKKELAPHSYTSFVKFDGIYHTKICSGCSLPYEENGEIVKYTHNIVDGRCTECNATEQAATQGLEFELNGDSYTLTGIASNAAAEDIVVPTFYNGKIVTAIKESAFENNTTIRSIVIPDGVTTIARWAFWNCSSLATITIGKGVKTIERAVFYGNNITRVNYTGSVEDWCKIDFAEDSSHPLSQSKAGSRDIWLSDGSKIENITLPDDLTEIKPYTFYQCESIKNIALGKNVAKIGDKAFYNCKNLGYIDFAEAPLESIGEQTFYGCDFSDLFLELPATLETLKTGAFQMTRLKAVTIPGSVKTIGQDCFLSCTSLFKAELGEGVEIISGSAFNSCVNLSNLILNSGLKEIWATAFQDCESLENVTFPVTLEQIYGNAFNRCPLKSVTIPASCKNILNGAFQACGQLTSLTIEGGNTPLAIGEKAFMGSASLTEVVVPDRVTEIGKEAFKFGGLTKITIGKGVAKIGTDAFYGCKITEFTISEDNKNIAYISGCIVDISAETVIMTLAGATVPDDERVTKIGPSAFQNSDIETVKIPERIGNNVGNGAFRGCKNLVTVELPNSMTVIPEWTFAECDNLANLTFGNQVEEIGISAFKDCPLLNVQIPDTVKRIGGNAFNGCTLLESALGDNVEFVGQSAFGGCKSYSLDIEGGMHYIGKWVVGCDNEGVTSFNLREDTVGIAGSAFNSTAFSTITLPPSVKYICPEAFSENTALTNITLSSNLLIIGNNAFSGCSNLAEITIPASVIEIGSSVFTSCYNLKKITFTNPEGWERYYPPSTSGTPVTLTTPTTNASNFVYSFSSYIWKRAHKSLKTENFSN